MVKKALRRMFPEVNPPLDNKRLVLDIMFVVAGVLLYAVGVAMVRGFEISMRYLSDTSPATPSMLHNVWGGYLIAIVGVALATLNMADTMYMLVSLAIQAHKDKKRRQTG